jgi:hypothetical protein
MAKNLKDEAGGQREMYDEISNLVGSIAKALEISDSEVIDAAERGELAIEFGADANGNRFVSASMGQRQAKIYQGAIKHDEQP